MEATNPETLHAFSGPFPLQSNFTHAYFAASTCHHQAQPPGYRSSKRELSFFVQYRAYGSAAISTPASIYAKSVQTSHSPPTKHLHTQPPRSEAVRPCLLHEPHLYKTQKKMPPEHIFSIFSSPHNLSLKSRARPQNSNQALVRSGEL